MAQYRITMLRLNMGRKWRKGRKKREAIACVIRAGETDLDEGDRKELSPTGLTDDYIEPRQEGCVCESFEAHT